MLSENSIKQFASKWQTTEQNVAREYFQNIFLAAFYKIPNTEKIAFKGGTALRIVHQSPRFSEDLDFTSSATSHFLQQSLKDTEIAITTEGFDINVPESKPTSGGWFAIIETSVHSWTVRVELNISTRKKDNPLKTETILVSPSIIPSYTLVALNEETLVEEKINALLTRRKPRDFFDLYYILRSRLAVNIVAKYQSQLLNSLKHCKDKSFTNELKIFLPRSYWNVINNLGPTLKKELERF